MISSCTTRLAKAAAELDLRVDRARVPKDRHLPQVRFEHDMFRRRHPSYARVHPCRVILARIEAGSENCVPRRRETSRAGTSHQAIERR